MNTHFLRNAAIAILALVSLLPGAVEVSATDATAALSPPSNPLGDRAITDNNLARRVVLYEEDPGIPGGTSAVGSVVWSSEMMLSPGAGKAAELTVRADIEIPERKMEMTWRLRHDTDLGSSTSHTIEIAFKLPPDFPSGGIFNVPGLWMKPAKMIRGTALTGVVVRGATGYFIMGFSAVPANTQLLKDRPPSCRRNSPAVSARSPVPCRSA